MLITKSNRIVLRSLRCFSQENKKFSPFSVGLENNPSKPIEDAKPGGISKLMSFFGKKSEEEEKPKVETVTDKYKEQLDKENEKLDSMGEADTQKQILKLIETNINAKYLRESRLEQFFQKCWDLKNPKEFMENKDFRRFVYSDLKSVLGKIDNPTNYVEFTKFMVFFRADDDPELFDLLADGCNRFLRRMPVDDILTILVNFAHTLNPNAQELFTAANQEFA